MPWFASLKLGHKLMGLLLLCAATTVVVGVVGTVKVRELATMQTMMYESEVVPIRQIGTAAWQAAAHYRRLYDYVVKTDPKGREDTLAFNKGGEAAVIAAFDYERAHPFDDRQKQLLADFDATWPVYLASVQKVETLARQGDQPAALTEMQANTDGLHVKIRKILIEFSNLRDASAKTRAEAGVALVAGVTRWIVGCAAVGVGIALALGLAVTRSIVRQIGGEPAQVARVVAQIAGGDLQTRVDTRAADRQSILHAVVQMQGSLAAVVGSIRTSTESVSVASREIASGNIDLSSRTEQQAASLEQTASSMTQLTQTVKQNADNARQANTLAALATEKADAGNDAMQGMVSTIEKISGSSTKISEITGVIEGIAFQTNILALNAAVEAARAGEQGRGFAVVASEVRSLAQRSASAAKEIKTLIGASVSMIQDGATQALAVGSTIGQVKDAIKRVSDIVGEITAASDEQTRGIEQVHTAIHQMDEVTQQNAALVEEAAAAAQSLEEQAGKLKDVVSVFKLVGAG
ncbi:methyl-accepting chemotaxis protein [Ralstonia chuxiongensis]|uniref:Methyl-accepting chemotaxis protein n=1 Tax=Ralstonia chuxiongensis TaxID=2957504 RepID=A0AA41WNI4_9RALS|nr:methyl-accepting chemotaxis protein [Ralstonia chuxiongensis]MCP1171501.1 methyl-accepting chemotaxis protein [Ralstonia chuxiongensis]